MANPQSARTDAGIRPSPRLLAGLFAGVFGIAYEALAVATAMPAAAQQLNAYAYYGWAFSLFIIGQMFGTAVSGRYCDRLGPVKPMFVGATAFVGGLLVSGSAPIMAQLLIGRLAQGLGAGCMLVALMVLIGRAFTEQQRARVMTWVSAAWVIPAVVGPYIAGFLTVRLSWHWAFLAVLPVLVLAFCLLAPIVLTMSRTGVLGGEPEGGNAVPVWAAAVAAIGVSAVQFAGQQVSEGFSLWVPLFALAGIALLAISLPKLMPPGFGRLKRGLPSVMWARALFAGAFFGAEPFLVLMLVQTRGFPNDHAGAVLTVGAIGWSLGAWAQSQSWMRLRRDQLIVIGAASVAVGVTIASLPAWFPTWWWGLVSIGWMFSALGMGLGVASTSLVTLALSRREQQGRNTASLQAADALGVSLLIGLANSVYAAMRTSGNVALEFGPAFSAMTVVAVLGVIVALRIGTAAEPKPRVE